MWGGCIRKNGTGGWCEVEGGFEKRGLVKLVSVECGCLAEKCL